MFLDRLDGELARASGKTSPWGHRYDLISDTLCNAIAFLGLGLGLRAGLLGAWAPWVGLAAGLAVAAILWLVMRMEARHGVRAGELRWSAAFDPDDALIAVPVLVWLGLSDWLLLAAGIGAPAFAIFMLWIFAAALRGPGAPG
jgi:phosphatidylglycerophosphate synthase